jgi:hypothetical protein
LPSRFGLFKALPSISPPLPHRKTCES